MPAPSDLPRPGPAITVADYQAADRAVAVEESRRGFAAHAMTYALANAVMVTANLAFASEFIWFPFPLLFWGFGLFMHYLFGVRRIGQEITKRQASVERRASQQRAA
jgi:2TM domain